MNKQQIGEEIEVEDFILTYFITKTEVVSEGEKHSTYGIEIIKQSLSQIEKAKVEDVTTDKVKIERIVNCIKENIVTPIHLYEVIENFL